MCDINLLIFKQVGFYAQLGCDLSHITNYLYFMTQWELFRGFRNNHFGAFLFAHIVQFF